MDSTYIVAESTEWYSVQSNSFWMVSGNAHFNGSAIISGFNAIIDSGTSVIVAPTVAAKSFWAAIPNSAPYGNGYYTYDCDTPPSISFSFHNGPALWQLTVVSLGKVSASSSRCVGSIVGQDIGVNAWVLGDSFMAGVYSTFGAL